MIKLFLKYGLILILLLSFNISFAASIDRQHWRGLREGMGYEKVEGDKEGNHNEDWWSDMDKRWNEKNGHRTPKEKEYDYLKEREREKSKKTNDNKTSTGFNVPAGVMIVMYVLLAGVLIFVIYLLFIKNPIRTDKKFEEVKEEVLPVHQTVDELTAALNKYLKNENYREAIRIYFIFIIKALRDKEWIQWEKEKTNHTYLFEIRDKKQFEAFSETIYYFELVWFGHRELTKEQYDWLAVKFDQLLKSIKNSHE